MTEFEFIERSDSFIVKIWVLLEGSPDPEQLAADITHVKNLDDFKRVLIDEFNDELKNITKRNIVLLHNNNTLKPSEDVQTLANIATAKNPLVVRYPISAVNIKVTLIYGQKHGKREIPHTSGSFDQLKALAREIFEDLEEGIVYFANNKTGIWNTYNFNAIVKSQTTQEDNNVMLKLKVLVKGQKKYSDWKLKVVFKDILRQPTYESLADMQKFYMKEYAPLDPPFTGEELKNFVLQLNNQLLSFDKEFGNEIKNRAYINAFMSHALSGSLGYGSIDYWVIFVDVLLLLYVAKSQDMDQGVAQVIVQMQSVIERSSKQEQDHVIYGIATTGKLWRFVRWNSSPENSEVHISQEYTCSFENSMETEKKVLTYIAQILKAQVDAKSEPPSKRVKVND
ncbi:hypothetical protein RhiirC2_780351 [Rhizophagus irregularis]|uniref:Crinkler family protein n=1 Tax=Rhizophagus irregularis TaxID=588596 RepID=A0A2N1N7V1_9GLOM|nr:hypothetical protein RhiirC2_780351 [Rhizophagus irregularis]